MIDGELVAACEQERYTRDKHSKRFPSDAIADCLKIGGLKVTDLDEIAFGGNPVNLIRKTYLEPAIKDFARIGMLLAESEKVERAYRAEHEIRDFLKWAGPIRFFDHHRCHLASTFYPSGFEDAALISIDALGDNKSMKIGFGDQNGIKIKRQDYDYPNSLGQVYAAITCFLGWKNVHHEGIIMALASFGESSALIPNSDSTYIEIFRDIIRYDGAFDFEINQEWVDYYHQRDKWVSNKFVRMFGQRRSSEAEITRHHRNLAAALQDRLQEVVLGIVGAMANEFGSERLCLSGGVALNCALNGKIEASGLFNRIYVQPASGDAGLAIGACYLLDRRYSSEARAKKVSHYYLGSKFGSGQIETALRAKGIQYSEPEDLIGLVASYLAKGKVVGWFQGQAEFGPRALGNRSILTRPFPIEIRDQLNSKVKHRETFRPFAPAILEEKVSDYFDIGQESPHMLIATKVKKDKLDQIPACVHVDGTARVQTVSMKTNQRFYKLIEAFCMITGCPVLLNTSFNIKGEPVVNSPEHAIDCFSGTEIDVLAIGNFLVLKEENMID